MTVVADGGEDRPHPYSVRVTASLLGGALDDLHAPLERLLGEVGVEDHLVERAAAERERVRAERDDAHRQMFVERRVEVQQWIGTGRPVVSEDHLASGTGGA